MINIEFGFESVDISMELFDDFVEGDNVTLEDSVRQPHYLATYYRSELNLEIGVWT